MGKNTVDASQWLDKRYEESVPIYSTVKYWFDESHHYRTSTNDARRSEEAETPENIAKSREICESINIILKTSQRIA